LILITITYTFDDVFNGDHNLIVIEINICHYV